MGLGSAFVWILFAITLAECGRRGRMTGGRRGEGSQQGLWAWPGLSEGMGSAGWHREAHGTRVPVGLGWNRAGGMLSAGRKSQCCVPCRLDPPCQSLAVLGSWACSLLVWAAVIAEGFEPLIPCRPVAISAAFGVEICIFEPSLHFKAQFSPSPAQGGVSLLKTLAVSSLHNAALHWGLPCALLCG